MRVSAPSEALYAVNFWGLWSENSSLFIPSPLSLRCPQGRSQTAMWTSPSDPNHEPKLKTGFSGVAVFLSKLQCPSFCEAEMVIILDVEGQYWEASATQRDEHCRRMLMGCASAAPVVCSENCLMSSAVKNADDTLHLTGTDLLSSLTFLVCLALPCKQVMSVSYLVQLWRRSLPFLSFQLPEPWSSVG